MERENVLEDETEKVQEIHRAVPEDIISEEKRKKKMVLVLHFVLYKKY